MPHRVERSHNDFPSELGRIYYWLNATNTATPWSSSNDSIRVANGIDEGQRTERPPVAVLCETNPSHENSRSILSPETPSSGIRPMEHDDIPVEW